MAVADAEAVIAIYAEGIATGDATFDKEVPTWEAWDRSHLKEFRLVCVDDEGSVAGWVACSSVSERCVYEGVVENSVYIGERFRGRGVGAMLLKALTDATDAAGVWTIQTGIFPENTASIRLHERAGFRHVGVRERLGRDTATGEWRDVVLLERRSPVVQ